MHTSMVHDGEYFIANVQAPAGATIDYVFQIAKSRSGAFVDIWDVNGEEKAFHSIVLNEGFTEIEASPLISNRIIEHEQVRDRSVSRTCQTEGGVHRSGRADTSLNRSLDYLGNLGGFWRGKMEGPGASGRS